MAEALKLTRGFFAVDYVGQIKNPEPNAVIVLMVRDEGTRLAGEMYTYEGNGVWQIFNSGGGGVTANALVGPDSSALVGPDSSALVGP